MIKRLAVAWSVVEIPAAEVDRIGVHVANIEGMRRPCGADRRAGLRPHRRLPGAGVARAVAAVIGGDASAACIAAASVLAKVSRDRTMVALDDELPGYGFAGHKGYSTAVHTAALNELARAVSIGCPTRT
ncbi:hypothetical protein GS506_22345 [Rhodococcus hoagii]|nr:hypothetical protein [Prescottella equi]